MSQPACHCEEAQRADEAILRLLRFARNDLHFLLLFLLVSFQAFAAPITERLPASTGAPLDLLSSQATQLLVPQTGDFANRLIIAAVGNSVVLVDTETWALYADQPSDFPATVGGIALLPDGKTLIVTLADGNIGKIELDNIVEENTNVADATDSTDSTSSTSTSDPRVIHLSDKTAAGPLTAIVADPDIGESVVTFINTDDKLLDVYDLESETFTPFTLDATPHDLVFADTEAGQKIYVSASGGKIFTIDAGGSSVVTIAVPTGTDDTALPELPAIAATPDGEYVYAVDSTNTAVWVVNASTSAVVDQTTAVGTDPVRIDTADENTGLSHILLTNVNDPADVYAYVSGDDGISILDASSPDIASAARKIIDMDESTADVLDPLALSGTPGPLAASTSSDGYIYSSNGNAEISVITDNPFVTIDTTTAVTVNSTATSFTISFQSDETGTYEIRANSNLTGSSGTQLTTGTVDTADTAVAVSIETASFDRDVFEEGTNRIFVFVTDAGGNVGRDAYDITIDRPPPAVTVNSSSFGNKKVYVTFGRLTDADISQYHLVAKLAANQASPTCPGSLDFTDSPDGTGTLDQGACATSPCTGSVSGLTNGAVYCVAVRAEDDGGQIGDFGTGTDSISPERTVGPAGLLGEAGCGLRRDSDPSLVGFGMTVLILLTPMLVILSCRRRRRISPVSSGDPSLSLRMTWAFGMTFLLVLFLSFNVFASEIPSEHKWFSFELKGGVWYPTNLLIQDFYGKWGNLMAETEFGLLYKSQFNATIGTGYLRESGAAVGVTSGAASGDTVTLLQIPIRMNFIYRFDYKEEQILVPYVGAGPDYVFFRENVGSDVTKGWKFGIHGEGGVAILLDRIEDIGSSLADSGIDDIYFTLEGRYSKIDGFKSTGLDLSAIHIYAGLLIAF